MMNIILHCGGMPFNGNTVEHQSLGGSETSAYYLAKQLALLGHRVSIFTACTEEMQGEFDNVNYMSHGNLTEETPLGATFHAYAENTPHDVMIIQRHPMAFQFKWASKINIWWLHDLALKHQKSLVTQQMWNVDAVWTVSEYHRSQICDVWNFNKSIVHTVHNGIDNELVVNARGSKLPESVLTIDDWKDGDDILIYSSRPERGLEHLIAPNGIMERLGDKYHLLVCAYDNVTPSTQKYYEYLAGRCEALPNVTNIGSLTKAELYNVMQLCDYHVYPTNFEEVSCITAMEDMACGLPLITSKHAALPETCKDSGTVLIPLKNGDVDVNRFVDAIKKVTKKYDKLVNKQVMAAPKFYWPNVINDYVDSIESLFVDKSQESIIKHLVEHSDIVALDYYRQTCGELSEYSQWLLDKILPLYDFANDPATLEKHYEDYYADSTLTKQTMDNSPRFIYTASLIGAVGNGGTILDYGCGHGHFTINLAKQNPDKQFIGVDVSAKNIKFAKEWAEKEQIYNVQFYHADIMQGFDSDFWHSTRETLDCVLVAEVLEHVVNFGKLAGRLVSLLKENGKFIATTPYGRWEWQSFEEYYPYRFHLHHFEYADIQDVIGSNTNNFITNVPAGNDKNGYLLGSYVWGFTKDDMFDNCFIGMIDYGRKFKHMKPRQLCSLNMIAYDCEDTIAHAINSAIGFVDEIVIGVDENTTDMTREEIAMQTTKLRDKDIALKMIDIESPLITGFSKARNRVIDRSTLDWILWIDADEIVYPDNNTRKLLRHNQFNGYAVKQHHYSVNPAGILKTDLPLRLFRNNVGIKFHGVVHEHPEVKLNDGAGHAQLIDTVVVGHYGYDNEDTRRGRFERNLDLMIRDREENPTRKLGKMLWVRDLAMMNQYELEYNGSRITENMVIRCKEALKTWRELVDEGETRLVLDSMSFYNQSMEILGYEFEAAVSINMSKQKGGVNTTTTPTVVGLFANRKDFENLTMLLLEENYDDFDSRYY